MTICFFSNIHISKLRGGVERVTYTLSQTFQSRGYDIIMISSIGPANGDTLQENQYVLPDRTTYSQKNIDFVSDLLKKHNIQIIINQSETQSSQALLKYFLGKYPIITCIHTDPLAPIKSIKDNWDLWKAQEGSIRFLIRSPYYIARCIYQQYTRKKYLKQKYSALYNECDAIVLLSKGFERPFCKISGLKNVEKLYAIGNPNSFEEQHILKVSNKENIVLFVGRLVFSPKRCDRILKIWKRVEKYAPDWNLIILGDGPDREMFYALKEKLDLKRVTFTGMVDPRPYYEKAAISCITSTHEGFSLAASESLQYGAVPIAFGSYEAINDIIDDNKTGFIIKPFNTRNFSKTVLELIKNPMLLKTIQHNIAARKDKFDKNAIANQWERLFYNLTSKH